MQPVVRALSVLSALASHRAGLGLQDLATTLDLPASTVHRLTQVLLDEGYLTRAPDTKHFLLGRAVRTLVSSTNSFYVQQVAEPEMRRLNRATGENTFLAEMIGDEVTCFAFLSGTRNVRLLVNVGTVIPVHAAASARVLVADLPDTRAREILTAAPLEALRPSTMTDPDQVIEHLDDVRSRGYDICDDEMESGIWAAAAPIRDLTGRVRAALAVLAPSDAGDDEKRRTSMIADVTTAADRISENLGYQTVTSSA